MPSFRITATAVLVFLIDRASKIWVVEVMSLDTRFDIPVWPPFLNLKMAWNEGVNFGLLASNSDLARTLLAGLALIISAALLFWANRQADQRLHILAGVVIGGAMGNVWDRFQYGAVADFLNVSCCGINNPYAFNIADVAIFVGAFGLVIYSGRAKIKA